MNVHAIAPQVNHMLAGLEAADWAALSEGLELVRLRAGQLLSNPGQRIRHVYFPTSAVVAMHSLMPCGEGMEVAVVGHEGLVGLPVLTGGDAMPYRVEVRCTGYAYRLPAASIRDGFNQSPALRRLTLLYAQALLTQVAQIAVCNRQHTLQKQLCRWLLLTLDRMPVSELAITQQGIADSLGMRREGVAAAMSRLADLGMIRHSRGRVAVLERTGLEGLACSCYGIVRDEHARLLPPQPEAGAGEPPGHPSAACGDGAGPHDAIAHLARLEHSGS